MCTSVLAKVYSKPTFPFRYKFIREKIFQTITQKIKKSGSNRAALQTTAVLKNEIENWYTNSSTAYYKATVYAELALSTDCSAALHCEKARKQMISSETVSKSSPISKIAIIGSGFMGSGIANISTLHGGFNIILKDISEAALDRARKHANEYFNKAVARGDLLESEKCEALERITYQTDWKGFDEVDVVIEAVFEEIKVKQNVLKELEEHVSPNCIIASNTSALSISEIAKFSERPERVIGMHYFSPVESSMILEVVRGDHCSLPEDACNHAVEIGLSVGKRQGLATFCVKEGPGFYLNRCLAAIYLEHMHLVFEGVDAIELDKLLREFGFVFDLSTVMDMVGIDVAYKVCKHLISTVYKTREPGTKTVDFMKELVDRKFLGKKTNLGFYRYEKGKKLGVNEEVMKMIKQRQKGSLTFRLYDFLRLPILLTNQV